MPISFALRSKLLPILDYLLIVAAGLLAYLLRFDGLDMDDRYLLAILLTGFITVYVMHASQVYLAVDTQLVAQFKRLIIPLLIVLLLITLLGYLSKSSDHYSRLWTGLWFFLGITLLLLSRIILALLGRNEKLQSLLARRLVLVGPESETTVLGDHIRRDMSPWLSLCGEFPIARNCDISQAQTAFNELFDWNRRQHIDDIIFVPPPEWNDEQILAALHQLQQIPANLHLGPMDLLNVFPAAQRVKLGDMSLMNLSRQPLDSGQRLLKGLMDRFFAVIILSLAAPLMITIATLIKLETRGPVLFKQQRYGFRREIITVYKFRSMIDSPGDDPEVIAASVDDPRVTRVGRILRRFSLDELPQLFNVLDGSMALTGPRPHALPHDDQYALEIDQYLRRHKVKPGITGWAQAHGYRGEIRNPDDLRHRLEHDLYYVENWSPLLDLEILLRTVFIVINGRNAY